MYSESDLLPISALQHLSFCERQCALIHIERLWAENRLTAEGRILHERVHHEGNESRKDIRIVRSLTLRSLRLGLSGVSDVIEFHRTTDPEGARIPEVEGLWKPFPVEYKRGKPKGRDDDRVQLCAQALCLEEMLNTPIVSGALFYGQTRHREEVNFTPQLRGQVEGLAAKLHTLIRNRTTPPPVYEKKCEQCSLKEECLPQTIAARKSVARFVSRSLRDANEDLFPEGISQTCEDS